MPGGNCCLNNSGSCESDVHKHLEIRFLQISTGKGSGYPERKKQVFEIIERYRVMSKDDHIRFKEARMYICTLHFEERYIIYG